MVVPGLGMSGKAFSSLKMLFSLNDQGPNCIKKVKEPETVLNIVTHEQRTQILVYPNCRVKPSKEDLA